MRKIHFIAVLAAGVAALAAATAATSGSPGFKTSQGAMIDPVAPGASYEAIISVGDTLGDGYMFESIPDGISLATNGEGTVDLYVNHETSTVPFPYTFNQATGTGSGFNDFTNSLVSKLRLHQKSGGVLSGSYAISSDLNFQRFCSNFLATEEHGFDRPLLLTNEEGIDWVNRSGTAWPATIGAPEARQIGAVVAIDEQNGKVKPIWGMGRHNHENSVAIPGYGKPVVLSGDDTFVSNPAQAQLYSYIADDSDAVWNDEGDLWAFVADGVDDYYDFADQLADERDRQVRQGPEGHRDRHRPRRHRADGGRQGLPAAAERRHLAARRPVEPRHRRPAVGARALGRHPAAARLPVRPRRGHRLRPAARDAERRLRRRQRPRRDERRRERVHLVERARLEARARQERPDEGDLVLDPDRG